MLETLFSVAIWIFGAAFGDSAAELGPEFYVRLRTEERLYWIMLLILLPWLR